MVCFFLGNMLRKQIIGCSKDCQAIEAGWECPVVGSPCRKICSNGILNTGETCDDGNLANGDGCNSACQIESGWKCRTTPPPSFWYAFGLCRCRTCDEITFTQIQ